ncbi:MAG: hypothetical protein ACR2HF_02655 [Methylococcaceae bacterium]
MTRLASLSKDSLELINRLSSNDQGRSPLVTIALAKALSILLPLPTAPTEAPEQLFRVQCSISVDMALSRLNELVLVNLADIRTYVRQFYLLRYYNAFPMRQVCCLTPQNVVADFFNLQMGITEDMVAVMTQDPLRLTQYHNSAIGLFETLMASSSNTTE